jgi:hypothetical protein
VPQPTYRKHASVGPQNLYFRLNTFYLCIYTSGEKRNAYRILVGNPEGKRPLGRPKRTWVDNIKMDLREIELDNRDWIDVAQDRD